MKNLKRFPLTIFCVVLIWVLCLCNPPETPLNDVPFIDKWTHVAMYAGTMSIFWIEYWQAHYKGFRLSHLWRYVLGIVLPVLMSGAIELIQAYCTGGRRSGDWLDFAANTIGVVIGFVLGRTALRYFMKRIHKKEQMP